MAIVFPSSPVDLQVFNASPGVSFVYRYDRWRPAPMNTALPKNLVANPEMMISQEFGSTGTSITSAYIADMWLAITNAPTGRFFAKRDPTRSIYGSAYRIYMYTSTVQASPGAGDFTGFKHSIEGQMINDLRWGTSAGKAAVVRFGLAAPIGVYSFALRNGGGVNRTFPCVVNQTLDQLWQEHVFAIPPCLDGVWASDNTIGLEMWWGFATGSSQQVLTPGQWNVGGGVGVAGQTNGLATLNATHQISDVGLYVDPYKTGVAPPWEPAPLAKEQTLSQRYWYKYLGGKGLAPSATAANSLNMEHPAPMRAAPAAALVGAVKVFDGLATPTISAIASSPSGRFAAELNTTVAGLTVGRAVSNYWQSQDIYIAMSARM